MLINNSVLLFAPWKTGSTLLIEFFKSDFSLVIKEIFHEDYYESVRSNSALSIEWYETKKSSPSWFKYVLDFDKCIPAKEWCASIANDIFQFNVRNNTSICFQVSESIQLTTQIFQELQKIGNCELKLIKSEYDSDVQSMSIIHNYLEGNSYFVANALIFFIINESSIKGLTTVFKKLSVTGMIMAAKNIVGLLPLRLVITIVKYYSTAVTSSENSVETCILPQYNATLMWSRYDFICGEYFKCGSSADFAELICFLNRIEMSRSVLSNLLVSKEMVGYSSGIKYMTARMDFDRSFIKNLMVASEGKFRPLNMKDKSTQCIGLTDSIYIYEIILQGGANLKDLIVQLDGIQIDLDTTPLFNANNGESIYLSINRQCTTAICVEAYCSDWPEIYVAFEKV
jgi:hypothetical protein